jgi:hypothetical protein
VIEFGVPEMRSHEQFSGRVSTQPIANPTNDEESKEGCDMLFQIRVHDEHVKIGSR